MSQLVVELADKSEIWAKRPLRWLKRIHDPPNSAMTMSAMATDPMTTAPVAKSNDPIERSGRSGYVYVHRQKKNY